MSGVRKSSSKFALDDIDSMVTKGNAVKKEPQQAITPAVKPNAPKPEVSTAKPEASTAKPSSNKKRKISDPAELSIQDCIDFANAHRILHNLSHLALNKMVAFHNQLLKESDANKLRIHELQKSGAAKDKKLSDISKELALVKAEMQEMLLQHARNIDESNEQAQTSAAISIFQSRIKMAKEAEDKDFDRSAWDVEEWKRLVIELGGELISEKDAGKVVAEDQVQGSAMVAEEHEAEGAGKQVDQGNEGNDA